MPYKMNEQLIRGDAGEWVMDMYHAPFYSIEEATRAQDRDGIDRFYRRQGKTFKVQIKTDFLAQKHGNVIVETVSVDTRGIPGWAYTSQCDVLIWYIWHLKEVLYFWFSDDIRANLEQWIAKYGETAIIPNEGYNTIGIKLPLGEARKHTRATRKLDPYWMRENHKVWAGYNG